MSPTTDTFERDLRDLLHSAVDGSSVPLGVDSAVLVSTAGRVRRRRTAARLVAGVAAGSLLLAGLWTGLGRHTDVQPAAPPVTSTMIVAPSDTVLGRQPGPAGSPTSSAPAAAFAVPPVVEVDASSVTVLAHATVLGQLPRGGAARWSLSRTDPRVRVGILPAGTTLPMPWRTDWSAQVALTALDDGSYVYALAFPTAARAAAAVGVTFTSPGTATLTSGTALPTVTLRGPNLGYPGDVLTRTFFVDPSSRTFGVHSGLVGGPLGPLQATGFVRPTTIGADGAGALWTFDDDPALPEHDADVVGVVPAGAKDVRLHSAKGPIDVGIQTAAVPGSAYEAFWAQQYNAHGWVALEGLTSVSWTDGATGKRHTHTLR